MNSINTTFLKVLFFLFIISNMLLAQANWKKVTASAKWLNRSDNSYVVYDGKMWLIKGMNAKSNAIENAWYSENGIAWTEVKTPDIFKLTSSFQTVEFKNEMYSIGGSTC